MPRRDAMEVLQVSEKGILGSKSQAMRETEERKNKESQDTDNQEPFHIPLLRNTRGR